MTHLHYVTQKSRIEIRQKWKEDKKCVDWLICQLIYQLSVIVLFTFVNWNCYFFIIQSFETPNNLK